MSNLFNREEVIKMLKEGVCTVKFTKKDGTERVMKATLKDEVVQPLMEGTSHSVRAVNLNQVRCVDVDLNEWRSFNLDSVVSIS